MFCDQPVVFKCFFKFTHGDNNVTSNANAPSMASKAYWLVTNQEILAALYAWATDSDLCWQRYVGLHFDRDNQVHFCYQYNLEITFTEFFLVHEVREKLEDGVTPSAALSLPDDNNPFSDRDIVWLVEPLRGGSVCHWSGTMEHPLHKDNRLLATSLYALAHFSLAYTQDDMVLVDIRVCSSLSWSSLISWLQSDLVSVGCLCPFTVKNAPQQIVRNVILHHMFHSSSQ